MFGITLSMLKPPYAAWILSATLMAAGMHAGAEAPPRPAAGAPGAQSLTLTQVLEAAAQNADARVARSGVDAAQADVLAADHAPLPQLSAKASQIDLQNGVGGGNWLRDKRVDKSVGLDWTWERGDKRALRTASARSAVQAAQQDWRAVRQQQQMQAASAYFDLLAAQARVVEVQGLSDSAAALAELMGKRVQAGDAAPQDLSRSEVEAAKARNDLRAAEADRRQAALQLARLLGRPGDALAAVEDWPRAHAPAELQPTLQPWIDARPEVRAAQAREDAAQAALDLARAGRKSDVTWGVSLDHFPGTSTRQLELRLQMPLQLGYQQQGEIGRAQAQLNQARELNAKARADAELDLQQAWTTLQTQAALLHAQQDELLPRARALMAQAELAYRKGASSLTDLIEARRTLRAAVLDALDARRNHASALVQWRLLTETNGAAPEAAAQP